MKKLPLFELQIDESDPEGTGLIGVSLVNQPATEVSFLMFSKEKMNFAVGNNERRIIVGPVLIPEQIIYRRRPSDGFEFNVKFNSDQVEGIVQRFHKGNSNTVTLEHALQVQGADILNLFMSDQELGINSPKGFENLPDKTLYASYKITDDNLWNDCKSGKFTGFSLEGFFNMFPIQMKREISDLEIFKQVESILSSIAID
jgi:hypothetical protein